MIQRAWALRALCGAALVGLTLAAGSLTGPRAAEAAPGGYALQEAWPGIPFLAPIDIAAPRDGSDRIFVVQRAGTILVAKKNRGGTAVPPPKPFLDISSLMMPAEQMDQGHGGLISVAFPPDFAKSGKFAVFYGAGTGTATDPFRSIVATYKVGANPDVADPASGKIVLTVPKPALIHFGGGLCFAADGTLYVGIGDTGMKDDPKRVAQDTRELQGKILRIDVNGPPAAGKAYAIPADNPWPATPNVQPEIFAYGVRNPFRMRFDSASGLLWLGDPGQKQKEEIDVVQRGGNMGWAMMEADLKLAPDADPSKYVAPVFAYGRELGTCAIGGVVYHGQRCAALAGKYVFADHMSGKLFALPVSGARTTGNLENLVDAAAISSIEEDAQGELLMTSLDDGKVYTLVMAP